MILDRERRAPDEVEDLRWRLPHLERRDFRDLTLRRADRVGKRHVLGEHQGLAKALQSPKDLGPVPGRQLLPAQMQVELGDEPMPRGRVLFLMSADEERNDVLFEHQALGLDRPTAARGIRLRGLEILVLPPKS